MCYWKWHFNSIPYILPAVVMKFLDLFMPVHILLEILAPHFAFLKALGNIFSNYHGQQACGHFGDSLERICTAVSNANDSHPCCNGEWCQAISRLTDCIKTWGGNSVFCQVSKAWDWWLDLYNCSEIYWASRQHYCWVACQISKQYKHFNTRSHATEFLWDLTIRRLICHWIGLLYSAKFMSVNDLAEYVLPQKTLLNSLWPSDVI